MGVSTRGALCLYRASQALALVENRDFVIPDDVKRLAVPVLSHRVIAKGYLQGTQRRRSRHWWPGWWTKCACRGSPAGDAAGTRKTFNDERAAGRHRSGQFDAVNRWLAAAKSICREGYYYYLVVLLPSWSARRFAS